VRPHQALGDATPAQVYFKRGGEIAPQGLRNRTMSDMWRHEEQRTIEENRGVLQREKPPGGKGGDKAKQLNAGIMGNLRVCAHMYARAHALCVRQEQAKAKTKA